MGQGILKTIAAHRTMGGHRVDSIQRLKLDFTKYTSFRGFEFETIHNYETKLNQKKRIIPRNQK